jgi:hypothetical protein
VNVIDPKNLLFSLPTLCDPAPATDSAPAPSNHRSLHEDDWRQIEFVVRVNLTYIQSELQKLAAFKQQHRRGPGWTSVYIRKEHPTVLASVGLGSKTLPTLPVSRLTIGGGDMVKGGFALCDNGDWFMYGQCTEDGHVLHVALSPGHSLPSEQFARAVSQFAQTTGLLLVDWYAGATVDTLSAQSILAWAAGYQRQ